MIRCTSCGGELISVGGDDLYCTYCGNTYGRDDLSRTKPIDKDGIRRFDIGANVFDFPPGSGRVGKTRVEEMEHGRSSLRRFFQMLFLPNPLSAFAALFSGLCISAI